MKWLVIILLIFNVCYLGWEINEQNKIDINNSSRSFVVSEDTDRLKLLSQYKKKPLLKQTTSFFASDRDQNTINQDDNEYSAQPDPSKNDPIIRQNNEITKQEFIKQLITSIPTFHKPPSQKQKTKKILCFSFGPFTDPKKRDELNAWLNENNITTTKRVADDKNEYFWVYLATNNSPINNKSIVADLQQYHIHDYQIINQGNLKNAISLGIFSSQLATDKRLAEIRKIGYQPIVVPYYKKEMLFWIDTKIDNNKTDILAALVNGDPANFNAIPVQCESVFNT